MNIDQKYMLRCIELGKNGLGTTAPNPMVGCVIVYDDIIIGEGFTSPYGEEHAEVNAVHSVTNRELLTKATLYVTLEPCSHFGKTPPCADLIVKNGIPKVVIGLKDPHDKVAGKGIKRLEEAGCKVTVGVLEKACREHHKRFLSFQEKQRPYIVLKWAETQDGYIAPKKDTRDEKPHPVWITNTYSRQLVHQWRSEEQAILVGTTTVQDDDPSLTVRDWSGENPIRIVIDSTLGLPQNAKVFDDNAMVILITESSNIKGYPRHVAHEMVDFKENLAKQICDILYKHNCTSVIIEGGAVTLQTFIDEDLWDEARIFSSSQNFGSGIKAPEIKGKTIQIETVLNDTLTYLIND